MKVIAKKNRELALINAQNTQNENRAETIELIVPEEYENYNKKIVFVTDDGTVWDVITNNEYKITNAITKYKQVNFYIWLTKEVDGESIDFRTKTKTLNFYHNEDASDEITPEEIHGVNTVVNLLEEEIEKVENLNIEATKIGDTTTVTITKKDGTTESVEINDGIDGQDGQDGEDGKDAKINGKNSIEIEAGNNITIDNTENGIIINSTGGGSGGTTDYTDLSNKPKINNVELNGNKSLNNLGIQPAGNYALESEIPDVSNFITNRVDDLINYYKKTEIFTKQEVNNLISAITTMDIQVVQTLPVQDISTTTIYLVPKTTSETNDAYDEYIYISNNWEQIGSTQVDLTGYATESWVTTQISEFLTQSQIQALISTSLSDYALESDIPTKTSDLTNDSGFITGYTETDPTVPSHVKSITQSNITSWNNKSDFSGNYNDLSNKPTIPDELKDLSDDSTHRLVTDTEKSTWNNKGTYSKPSGGIPKTDLASAVQTSLNKADTALQSHQDISGKLDTSKFYNDYYFSMPKTIYAKLNTEMKIYYNNITTSNYLLKLGQYTNSTTIADNDDYISILPTAKATKNIAYIIYDRYLNSMESGTTSFVINNTAPNSQTMLLIGDSFIDFNYIGPDLRTLFSNDNKTLTLIGTRGSGENKHEGYSGWKYTDFVSGDRASTSPFWDGSKFNFTYYMNQNGYSTLDSVFIQLGTNDASASSPNQNMTNIISAAQTMINSILEYNSNIKIYLGLTVMPSLKTSKFAEKYNGIGFNWVMRANMQKLNKALIDTFSNNSSIKIVANNLILDSSTEISDNVHPTRSGFTKIANQVYYTMMS